MEIQEGCLYTTTHEWVRREDDGTWTLGVSDHAQHALGDIVFVELPTEGELFDEEDEVVVVESVKAVSGVYIPVDGRIVEVNEVLNDTPDLVNEEPYKGGWLFRFAPEEGADMSQLLTPQAYHDFLHQ